MTDLGQGRGKRGLRGRHALITGGAGAIAGAIAVAYLEEGVTVTLADRDDDRVREQASRLSEFGEVQACAADLTTEEGVAFAMEAAASAGRVDILVNAVGMLDERPLMEMDVETWDRMIAVDLRSVFLACRAALPAMAESGWGRIINIASQLGQKGSYGMTHYCAAKAGVIGFTRALALEGVAHGVLVNAIAPGPIDTPFVKDLTPAWRAAKELELPLGRFGTPEEVAPTAVLLASDPGGNLFVGQTVGPNGGDVMQ